MIGISSKVTLYLRRIATTWFVVSLFHFSLVTAEKPNVILIVTDDQGYSDMGVTNRTFDVNTPNLDRLANSGMRFDNGYAPQVCAAPPAAR